METTTSTTRTYRHFFIVALLCLSAGVWIGHLGLWSYLLPEHLKDILPFRMLRAMHVTLVVAWIFAAAIGGVYHYIQKETQGNYKPILLKIHLWGYVLLGGIILLSYFLNRYGGREYWAFPPPLAIGIAVLWLLFAWNTFKAAWNYKQEKCLLEWPLYLWMWATGILFFLYTFTEVYLWTLPFFGKTVLRDITVQWKAYGSLVGSWNMMVYGTALYLATRPEAFRSYACSKTAYALYLIGLANLIMGWAHHIYPVPTYQWIKTLAYFISMTELIVLGKLLWDWYRFPPRFQGPSPYRYYLIGGDIWVFLNLLLAIAISIPAVNLYAHGTHLVVAHSMGTTIGINTHILLASLFYISEPLLSEHQRRRSITFFYLFNIGLIIFWLGLIVAGFHESPLIGNPTTPHIKYLPQSNQWMWVVLTASIPIAIAITGITTILIKRLLNAVS